MTDNIESMRNELRKLGVTNKETLANTPRRFLTFLEEYSIALREEYTDFKSFKSDYNSPVFIECNFYSICEHHLLPYFGKAFVAYVPSKKVIGISKVVKLTQHQFKKPSMQESVTKEIPEILSKNTGAQGAACVVKALHLCVAMRYEKGWMTTTSSTGVFKTDKALNKEFMGFIQPKLNEMKL